MNTKQIFLAVALGMMSFGNIELQAGSIEEYDELADATEDIAKDIFGEETWNDLQNVSSNLEIVGGTSVGELHQWHEKLEEGRAVLEISREPGVDEEDFMDSFKRLAKVDFFLKAEIVLSDSLGDAEGDTLGHRIIDYVAAHPFQFNKFWQKDGLTLACMRARAREYNRIVNSIFDNVATEEEINAYNSWKNITDQYETSAR